MIKKVGLTPTCRYLAEWSSFLGVSFFPSTRRRVKRGLPFLLSFLLWGPLPLGGRLDSIVGISAEEEREEDWGCSRGRKRGAKLPRTIAGLGSPVHSNKTAKGDKGLEALEWQLWVAGGGGRGRK